MNHDNLLKRIMNSDINVRHSIVTDLEGNILATAHRPGVTNFLSAEETAASLKRAAAAWHARKKLYHKIGPGLYAVAAFQKIIRMTFPLGSDNLIFVSIGSDEIRTDLAAGGQKQIIENVLNILSRDPTRDVTL